MTGVAVPEPAVIAELVRLPAVTSVPGDTLVGAAAAGAPMTPLAVAGRAVASGCLYLGGMALNDYADRDVDAVERPHRPIPSGRVDPAFALRLAGALTAAGLAVAGVVGGGRALRMALPLAGAVWAYDLALKDTAAGPVAMAGCRALDVALGASGGTLTGALVPAAAVAGHTLTITLVSRHEAEGGTPEVGRRALVGTSLVTAVAAAHAFRSRPRNRRVHDGFGGRFAGVVAGGLLGAYAVAMGRAELEAVRDPSPAKLQKVVGTGVLGFMPLEGALLAGMRRTAAGAAVAALWPVARRLARRRAVT
jgi:UbiA prenyltransferase family protein